MKDFFEESSEQSVVKATIVAKYFWAWARVVIPTAKTHSGKIAYLDLFAGPGRYKDGTKSTPLLVLERAIEDPVMRKMLVTYFNDADPENARSLKSAIQKLPGIETLKYEPQVKDSEVGEKIVKAFESMQFVPTLFFVDPWGYKGLSLRLVNAVLKDWGCDCIFFFNYNRINMGLGNPYVEDHMNGLFGKTRADALRLRLNAMKPSEREFTILEEIVGALRGMGGKYVLPFCFKNEHGNRTSHHLIFVSKHLKGYEIMKDIMAGESSSASQGVPSFQYNPADERYPLLFEFSRPLDDLESMILDSFAGRRLRMRQIYDDHNVGRRYVIKNYKEVLIKLEAKGSVIAEPRADNRRKNKGRVTFADNVIVTFPSRRE